MPEMTKEQLLDIIDGQQKTIDRQQVTIETLERKVAAHEQTIATITKQRDEKAISEEITRAAMSMGIIPDGIPDIIGGAIRDGWVANERGELELRDPKTGAVAFDVTPGTWAAAQAKGPRKYLFQSGQQSAGSGGFGSVKNPWSKDSWNDTEQAKVYLADPAKAEAMAKAAGSRVGALPPHLQTKTPY